MSPSQYTPAEGKARDEIDQRLTAAGWVVQTRPKMNLYEGSGQAVTRAQTVRRPLKEWTKTTVGQIAGVGSGATPNRGNPRFWAGGTIPWVTSGQLNGPVVRRGGVHHRGCSERDECQDVAGWDPACGDVWRRQDTGQIL